MFEIVSAKSLGELDRFVESHPNGGFTQLSAWHKVKPGWDWTAVISRGEDKAIRGSMSILIKRLPLGCSLLYSPRGPVCSPDDYDAIDDLIAGAREVGRKNGAYALKVDPDILFCEEGFCNHLKSLGFTHSYGPDGFEGIQARFNYRLYLNGRSEDELFMNLTQGCRRKVRIAQKNGVEVRAVPGSEGLDDFCRLMEQTGRRDGFLVRDRRYFERFLSALGDRARLYLGYYQGQAVCGAISVVCAKKCCYVYGASGNDHRDVMPNYLMQWEMIRWAVQSGCDVYDFQGVSGNLSPEGNHMYGLYQFKKGFNGTLDELLGEFDITYRPVAAAAAGLGRRAVSLIQDVRRGRAR